ncbi:MAG: tyrosine-type recombinase/integrase [Anaerolineae bacterium]|nr:tyrosine-type recombinase/integrase [Anaerolineae bacterium]
MKNDQITLSQALQGYALYAKARRLSPNTLNDYNNTFTKFKDFLGTDPPLAEITKYQVQEFLALYGHLSKKTVLNYHTGLSALWTWAMDEEGLVDEHTIRRVTPPDPEKPVIKPFSEQDVKLILIACERSRPYIRRHQREKSNHALPNVKRNKAIILTLLDTGVRASELCSITMNNVDFKNKQITVLGKGDKERVLQISNRTGQLIWRYLVTRSSELSDNAPLFASDDDLPLTRDSLLKLIKRIGNRAGVSDAHPHRFRHTFAINFLRNGGNIYALQALLGHSTLDMVKRYLKLSEQDCAAVHRKASPVANWGL